MTSDHNYGQNWTIQNKTQQLNSCLKCFQKAYRPLFSMQLCSCQKYKQIQRLKKHSEFQI